MRRKKNPQQRRFSLSGKTRIKKMFICTGDEFDEILDNFYDKQSEEFDKANKELYNRSQTAYQKSESEKDYIESESNLVASMYNFIQLQDGQEIHLFASHEERARLNKILDTHTRQRIKELGDRTTKTDKHGWKISVRVFSVICAYVDAFGMKDLPVKVEIEPTHIEELFGIFYIRNTHVNPAKCFLDYESRGGDRITDLNTLSSICFGSSKFKHLIDEDFFSTSFLIYALRSHIPITMIREIISRKGGKDIVEKFAKYMVMHEFNDMELKREYAENIIYIFKNEVDFFPACISETAHLTPKMSRFDPYPEELGDTLMMLWRRELSAEIMHNKFKRFQAGKDFKFELDGREYSVRYYDFREWRINSHDRGSNYLYRERLAFHDFLVDLFSYVEDVAMWLDCEIEQHPFDPDEIPENWHFISNTTELHELGQTYGWCVQNKEYLEMAAEGQMFFFYIKADKWSDNVMIGYHPDGRLQQAQRADKREIEVPDPLTSLEW